MNWDLIPYVVAWVFAGALCIAVIAGTVLVVAWTRNAIKRGPQ